MGLSSPSLFHHCVANSAPKARGASTSCLFAVATGLVCNSGLCTRLAFTRPLVEASSLMFQNCDWAPHRFSLTLDGPYSLGVIHSSRMLDACCGSGALG
jgi:hypothetical protein